MNQKFLEKGHTQMEVDSVHSTIERLINKKELFLPHELLAETVAAKATPFPYRAVEVYHDYFRDFSDQTNMRYDSIRPGNKASDPCVVDIRWLRYIPEGKILNELQYDDVTRNYPVDQRMSSPKNFPAFTRSSSPLRKTTFVFKLLFN